MGEFGSVPPAIQHLFSQAEGVIDSMQMQLQQGKHAQEGKMEELSEELQEIIESIHKEGKKVERKMTPVHDQDLEGKLLRAMRYLQKTGRDRLYLNLERAVQEVRQDLKKLKKRYRVERVSETEMGGDKQEKQ